MACLLQRAFRDINRAVNTIQWQYYYVIKTVHKLISTDSLHFVGWMCAYGFFYRYDCVGWSFSFEYHSVPINLYSFKRFKSTIPLLVTIKQRKCHWSEQSNTCFESFLDISTCHEIKLQLNQELMFAEVREW